MAVLGEGLRDGADVPNIIRLTRPEVRPVPPRSAYYGPPHGWRDTPVLRRSDLSAASLDEAASGRTARALVRQLQDGTPSIHVDSSRVAQGTVGFAPIALKDGEPAIIAKRLSELLVAS